jgi:hypothetical protein
MKCLLVRQKGIGWLRREYLQESQLNHTPLDRYIASMNDEMELYLHENHKFHEIRISTTTNKVAWLSSLNGVFLKSTHFSSNFHP